MITFKEYTKDELREQLLERKGFVFSADEPSADSSVEFFANVLIEFGVTKSLPEFVVKLDPNIHVFIYGDDFDGPVFFMVATRVAMMLGNITIQTIREFLAN